MHSDLLSDTLKTHGNVLKLRDCNSLGDGGGQTRVNHTCQHILYSSGYEGFGGCAPTMQRQNLANRPCVVKKADVALLSSQKYTVLSCSVNAVNTDVIWLGTRGRLQQLAVREDLSLTIYWFWNHTVVDSSIVIRRDLGVLIDSELTLQKHVSRLASSCFYQLRRLRQVRSRRPQLYHQSTWLL